MPLHTLTRTTEDILIGGGTGGNLRFITDILYYLHCTDGGTGYNFIYFLRRRYPGHSVVPSALKLGKYIK